MKEIELLGGNPTIIAVGGRSYKLIKKHLPKQFISLKVN